MNRNLYSKANCLFGIFVLCLLLMACNEDLGNYDYTEVNEIEISGIEEHYTLVLGKMTDIKPVLTFSSGHEDECSYEWLLVRNTTDNPNPYIMATTRDLQVPVVGEVGKVINNSLCYFRVTNEVTGIQYTHSFNISVVSDLNVGFLILNDVNGQSRLDLISFFEEDFTFKKDLIALTGSSMPVNHKPWNIVTYTDINSPTLTAPIDQRYAVIVLTENGAFRLHPLTYDYDEAYSLSYLIFNDDPAIFPNGHLPEKMLSPKGNIAYMYVNHNWLYYYHNGSYFFNQPVNAMDIDYQVYKASEHLMYGGSYAVLFNEDTQSFVSHQHSQMASGYIYTKAISVNESLFPYNNIDKKGYELIYMASREAIAMAASSPGFIILREKSTGYYYVGRVNLGTFEQMSFDRILGDDIRNAHSYAWNPADAGTTASNYPFLYYATDDKIYELDFSNNSGYQITSKVVYTAPTGQKISLIKYIYAGGPSSAMKAWNNYLLVATYDPQDTVGEKGQLQIMETQPVQGGLKVLTYKDKEMKWTGFGKIVGIDYKTK